MCVLVDRFETISSDVSVDLRRSQIGVPEEFLNDSQIRTTFEQVGRERMAQCVGVQTATVWHRMSGQNPPRIPRAETPASLVEEQCLMRRVGADEVVTVDSP